MKTVLKEGWGYWDVTHYPYGGCFRRATKDMECEIIGSGGKYPDEKQIKFLDGSMGVAKLGALEQIKEN